MKKEDSASSLFRKFPKTLAKDLQQFIILSPAHDLSAHHLQINVHIVQVRGIFSKYLCVWATVTNSNYKSSRIKLLEIRVTKDDILKIKSPNELIQSMLHVTKYGDLRDEICAQVQNILLEKVNVHKTYKSK
jgi:hypothetical protein